MAMAYTIRIHAIPLTDADGGRGCTVTSSAFAQAIEGVNAIFECVDIRFAFNPKADWHPRRDTSLNSLNNGGSSWWTEANAVAAKNRGEFTIFLRHGVLGGDPTQPAQNWFAYPPDTGQPQPARAKLPHDNIDFVAITNQQNKFATNGIVLAHEIGHYLGLFHTHPGWGTPDPATMVELVKSGGAAALDGDLLGDTAPDPGPKYYADHVDADLCGGPASFAISGVTFRPDRANLMSYYQRCQPPVRLSAQQVAVMRETVQHTSRFHLIADSAGIRYAGVFRAGNDGHALWVGDDWTSFTAKWKALSADGLRLIDLESYVISGKRRYAGVFRAGTGGHALWVDDDWKGFTAKWKELSADGLRLVDLETWKDGSTRKYAGVFRAGTGGHALWVDDDWKGFTAKWKELSADGLRLVDL
ncbi:MAG: hypothetical protein L0H41_03505, partial [Microlunatus sp.]|nr:hypothetical protein [Microlunatus sp.]